MKLNYTVAVFFGGDTVVLRYGWMVTSNGWMEGYCARLDQLHLKDGKEIMTIGRWMQ